MILPKFIAIQLYLESIGIAFGFKKYLEPIMENFIFNEKISIYEANQILTLKTQHALSIFKFLNYIGFINKINQNNIANDEFQISKIAKLLVNEKKENYIKLISPLILSWLPIKIFLKYLEKNPGSNVEDIRLNLGEQIIETTNGIDNYFKISGMKQKGISKPFNGFIIQRFLAEIAKSLDLIYEEKDKGPYYLTEFGLNYSQRINLDNFIMRRPHITIDISKIALYTMIQENQKKIIIFSSSDRKDTFDNFSKKVISNHKYYETEIDFIEAEFELILSKNQIFKKISNQIYEITYDKERITENLVNLAISKDSDIVMKILKNKV